MWVGGDTEVVLVLKGEVEPDKEGVVQSSEHLLLSAHILHFLLTDDVTLVQDLYWRERAVSLNFWDNNNQL